MNLEIVYISLSIEYYIVLVFVILFYYIISLCIFVLFPIPSSFFQLCILYILYNFNCIYSI